MRIRKRKPAKWHWPYCGRNELKCRHNVGHGPHIHSCDGCCGTKAFDKAFAKFKECEAALIRWNKGQVRFDRHALNLLTTKISIRLRRKKERK